MAYNKSERPDSPMKRRGGRRRKKVCVFCGKENNEISYKDVNKLRKYVSERGKQKSKTYRYYAICNRLIQKVCCTVIGKPMAVFLFKKKRLFSLRGK